MNATGNECVYAVTKMVYEHAIDDATRLFEGASEQGNKEIVVFQTGLTGSPRFVSSFYPISKIKEPQMNAQSRASGGRIHVCPQAYVSMHCGGHDADDLRFKIATEPRRARSYYFSVFSAPLRQIFYFKNQNNINNELVRTETNSGYSTFGG